MDAFLIESGDDLQDYKNLGKASRLLSFLISCFENNNFEAANLAR